MSNPKHINVLFLCTGNSARSIMAESYLNSAYGDRFAAYSAGSYPTGKVNPFAIELLQGAGIDTSAARSKSWDEFAKADAPKMNFVFTVCDNAAGEVCPYWPGQPISAHWPFEDPAALVGSDDAKRKKFLEVFLQIRRRIDLFANLPFSALDSLSLISRLEEIGKP